VVVLSSHASCVSSHNPPPSGAAPACRAAVQVGRRGGRQQYHPRTEVRSRCCSAEASHTPPMRLLAHSLGSARWSRRGASAGPDAACAACCKCLQALQGCALAYTIAY